MSQVGQDGMPTRKLVKITMRIQRTIIGLIILASTVFSAEASEMACINDAAKLPEAWKASDQRAGSLSPAPWSADEAEETVATFEAGMRELIGFFEEKPSAVLPLWDDSIEPLVQATHGSSNSPDLDEELHQAARKNLNVLIDSLKQSKANVACDDFETYLPLALFAKRLYPPDDPRTQKAVDYSNAALRECWSLEDAIGFSVRDATQSADLLKADIERLFDLHLWSLWFTEAQKYPDIGLPKGAEKLPKQAWQFFNTLAFPDAARFPGQSTNEAFVSLADLASHILHIPTGVHRYPLRVSDAPELYRFHRENFYAASEAGDLDVFASFVDTLRQYGCTPQNDIQVRDGTRILINAFRDNGASWIMKGAKSDYDAIHFAWTGLLGIRDRQPQSPPPISYRALTPRSSGSTE